MQTGAPSKVAYNNFDYTIKDSNRLYHRYRCMHYRSKGCKGLLKIDKATGAFFLAGLKHFCQAVAVTGTPIYNAREEYFEMARERAMADLGSSALRIWDAINKELTDKYRNLSIPIEKPSRDEIINQIGNQRRAEGAGDTITVLQTNRYARVSDSDSRLFLRFHFSYEIADKKHVGRLCKLLMWAHPDLLPILRRRGIPCFLDGTFRSVPQPFQQCLILMAFDDETELYVPIVFALVENKSSWTYWHFIHLVIVATECKFEPVTMMTDFERPMITAIKEQMPRTTHLGCFFHFKDAMRRKLKKLQVPEDQINKAMQRGMLDSLTLVDHSLVAKTLQDLCDSVSVGQHVEKWEQFAHYFMSVWCARFPFESWNASGDADKTLRIGNRTNNALESFNRQLNAEFASPHPNIFHFVDVIRGMSCRIVRTLLDIRSGNSQRPVRANVVPDPV
jgi:hypothetical protein